MLSSFISFSQTTNQEPVISLEPKLNINNVWYPSVPTKNDTMFCFNLTQSRYIFQKLISLQYCDTISIKQDSLITGLNNTNKVNTQIIDSLNAQLITSNKIEAANDTIVKDKDDIIKIKDKKIKVLEAKSTIKSIIIGVIAILFIIKVI
jgi:hypothetical protein